MKKSVLTLATVAAVVFGMSRPASAQSGTTNTPTFELAAGYQLLRAGELCGDDDDESCNGETFPLGAAVDAVWNLKGGGAFGIVAEGGWSRYSEDFTVLNTELSNSINLWHIAGGVRWTGRSKPTFWPYGQVLAGALVNHLSSEGLGTDFSDTTTNFMVQPGIGATFIAGDGWGIFGQVDYRRVFMDEDETGVSGRNDVRVFIGARMILD